MRDADPRPLPSGSAIGTEIAHNPSMDPLALQALTAEIDSFHTELDRRRFLKTILMAGLAPGVALDSGDEDFVRGMVATLIPAHALQSTGIDVVANLKRILRAGSQVQSRKIARLLLWSQRVSFLYGGEKIALRARGSKFALMRRMAKALSSLCLVPFWGDERSLALIDRPREEA